MWRYLFDERCLCKLTTDQEEVGQCLSAAIIKLSS